MQILIVEDQNRRFHSIIKRLKILFKELDDSNSVVVKNNYKDAHDYFVDNCDLVDLILLDVRMPNGDGNNVDDSQTGIKLYNEILKIKSDQKIIFWTVLERDEIIEKGIQINGDDYIGKQADYIRFFSKIDSKLGTNMTEKIEDIL